MLATSRLTSFGLMSSDFAVHKATAMRQRAARWAEVDAASIERRIGSSRPEAMRLRMISSEPMMPVKRLLKSWAMPPVNWPITSIFWVRRRASGPPVRLPPTLGRHVPAGTIDVALFGNADP